jgi:exonuclease III
VERDDDALVQPESRAAYPRLVRQGWTDVIRELHGQERVYTFWHYLPHRWQRNAGLRLDHLLLSPRSHCSRRTLALIGLSGEERAQATMHRLGSCSDRAN